MIQHATGRMIKMAVLIQTVDIANRNIQCRFKDGGTGFISVIGVPNTFIWPQEGEHWFVHKDGHHWKLDSKIDVKNDYPVDQMQPGEARIASDTIKDASGKSVLATFDSSADSYSVLQHQDSNTITLVKLNDAGTILTFTTKDVNHLIAGQQVTISGFKPDSYNGKFTVLGSGASAKLTVAISKGSIPTTITLDSVENWPTSGTVTIDSEIFSYSGLKVAPDNQLTGISKASDNKTISAIHAVGATVQAPNTSDKPTDNTFNITSSNTDAVETYGQIENQWVPSSDMKVNSVTVPANGSITVGNAGNINFGLNGFIEFNNGTNQSIQINKTTGDIKVGNSASNYTEIKSTGLINIFDSSTVNTVIDGQTIYIKGPSGRVTLDDNSTSNGVILSSNGHIRVNGAVSGTTLVGDIIVGTSTVDKVKLDSTGKIEAKGDIVASGGTNSDIYTTKADGTARKVVLGGGDAGGIDTNNGNISAGTGNITTGTLNVTSNVTNALNVTGSVLVDQELRVTDYIRSTSYLAVGNSTTKNNNLAWVDVNGNASFDGDCNFASTANKTLKYRNFEVATQNWVNSNNYATQSYVSTNYINKNKVAVDNTFAGTDFDGFRLTDSGTTSTKSVTILWYDYVANFADAVNGAIKSHTFSDVNVPNGYYWFANFFGLGSRSSSPGTATNNVICGVYDTGSSTVAGNIVGWVKNDSGATADIYGILKIWGMKVA